MNTKTDDTSKKNGSVIPQELESIRFIHREGTDSGLDPIVFGLTTCGFCREALKFLDTHGIAHSYVYVNELSVQQRRKIKDFVSSRFETIITFPFLIYGQQEKWISGFLRIEWERLFRV
jgi:glutaredoxin